MKNIRNLNMMIPITFPMEASRNYTYYQGKFKLSQRPILIL